MSSSLALAEIERLMISTPCDIAYSIAEYTADKEPLPSPPKASIAKILASGFVSKILLTILFP